MVHLKKGSMFADAHDAYVIPVNTVGVMGAGLARYVSLRWPEVVGAYKKSCKEGSLKMGGLLGLVAKDCTTLLMMPTKEHWLNNSTMEYLEMSLDRLMSSPKLDYVDSIALPLLGSGCGNLDPNDVLDLMQTKLVHPEVEFTIYLY